MKLVFADTCYWIALLNNEDSLHEKATQLSGILKYTLLITSEIHLAEFLNFFCGHGSFLRRRTTNTVEKIQKNPNVIVVPFDQLSFASALKLYKGRADKSYSFIDCVAMEFMRVEGISEILTSDHHFEQEGFAALLR